MAITMSKRQIIIILGALIIIIALFSGLPSVWNTTLYVIIGLLIIAVAYATTRPSPLMQKKSVPYVDAHNTASTPAFRAPVQAVTAQSKASEKVVEESVEKTLPTSPVEEVTSSPENA